MLSEGGYRFVWRPLRDPVPHFEALAALDLKRGLGRAAFEELLEDAVEAHLKVAPRDDVGELGPQLALASGNAFLQRHRSSRRGHRIDPGVQYECRTGDLIEPFSGVMAQACFHQAGVGIGFAGKVTPRATRAEQAIAVLVVELAGKAEGSHEALEHLEPHGLVHVAEEFELVAQRLINEGPRAGHEERSNEFGPGNRQLLADAGAHTDQPDNMNSFPFEVVEKRGSISCQELHRHRLRRIVGRRSHAAVVPDDDLVVLSNVAWRVVEATVTEASPSAHTENFVAVVVAVHLVVEGDVVSLEQGHENFPRGRSGSGSGMSDFQVGKRAIADGGCSFIRTTNLGAQQFAERGRHCLVM